MVLIPHLPPGRSFRKGAAHEQFKIQEHDVFQKAPRPEEQMHHDPSKPAQRMRPGFAGAELAPGSFASCRLAIMPMVFTTNSALTIMKQMSITIVFALAYNMLLGRGHAGPLVMRSMLAWAVLPVCTS